jgi:ribose transport system ATP-binding protein
MALVKRLASKGMGIIYISHYLDEVFEVGDRITVLKDGLRVGTFIANELDYRSLATKMIGRERSSFFERKSVSIGHPILEVRDLDAPPLVKNASFKLHRGEILGFGGLVGAGRSELMRVLFGVDQSLSGEVLLHEVPLKIKSPSDAIRAGFAMIPEDRKREGLMMSRSVLENIAIIQNEAGGLMLDLKKERTLIRDMVTRLSIATSSGLKPVGQLSGGNQQKVIIARWLDSGAEVFIFDEPTKGVDIGAKKQIYDLIVSLAEMGKGIMMVSSDMTELISMSDRIVIIRANAIVDIVDAKLATEQNLVEAFLGINS